MLKRGPTSLFTKWMKRRGWESRIEQDCLTRITRDAEPETTRLPGRPPFPLFNGKTVGRPLSGRRRTDFTQDLTTKKKGTRRTSKFDF